MRIFKTFDRDGFVRLEEDCGAAVTLQLHGDTAAIRSIIVPKEDRDDGVGSALLLAAESEAYKKGAVRIEADYSEAIEGMSDFLDAMEYQVREGGPVCMIDSKELFASVQVKEFLKKKLTGASFSSLEELTMSQWDELLGTMAKFSLRLGASDMGAFSKSMSGVVHDKNGVSQAIILCSEQDRGVHVDFLVSAQKKSTVYVMAALQGMLMEVYASGGAAAYPGGITAFCTHENVSRLMGKALSKKPVMIGRTMYAVKGLQEDSVPDVEIYPDLDEDIEGEWRREIARVPMQANIEWKAGWYRDRLFPNQKGDRILYGERKEV